MNNFTGPPVLNSSKHLCLTVTQGIVAEVPLLLILLLSVSSLKQGSTEASAIKEYVVKHSLPLVGHRKTSNDAKRYTKRPLVVVYYSVDFSFDYRTGKIKACSRALKVSGVDVFYCSVGFSVLSLIIPLSFLL